MNAVTQLGSLWRKMISSNENLWKVSSVSGANGEEFSLRMFF